MTSEVSMIRAEGLFKSFGTTTALVGIELEVARGAIVALLGPNGAGKTTMVRILSTLLTPDAGHVMVAGIDAVRRPENVRKIIGLAGQSVALDAKLTGMENLAMLGRLNRLHSREAHERARRLIEEFDLIEAAGRPVKTYSGGMRRRLDLAAALIADPPVVFLDEPTTGLDPEGRAAVWGIVRARVKQGTTVVLTTHYLEEADEMADKVVVLAKGRIIASGSGHDLKSRMSGTRFEVTASSDADMDRLRSALGDRPVTIDTSRRSASIDLGPGSDDLSAVETFIAALRNWGVGILSCSMRSPTLEEAYLRLTQNGGIE